MTDGGWLDGFPLHLLFMRDPSPSMPVLCLDAEVLGNVQLAPCPALIPVVVVHEDKTTAVSASKASISEPSSVWRVVMDRRYLPFRTESLSGWIECVDVAANENEGSITSERESEQMRVLSTDAVLVRITDDPRALDRELGVPACAPACVPAHAKSPHARFEVRPRTGAEYFVTRIPGPRRSPFQNLQLGKVAALRQQLPSWIPSREPASLVLEVCSKRPTCIAEFWPVGTERGLFAKSNWNALLVGDDQSVVKFPLLLEGVDRLRAQADQLEQVRRELPASLAEFVPRPMDLGLSAGQFFLRESVRPGRPIPLGWWKPNGSKTAYQSAAEFLAAWHQHPVTKNPLTTDEVDALLCHQVECVVQAGQRVDAEFSLAELHGQLRDRLVGQSIPRVRTHGDFWGGNLLVSDSGDLSGVLDWDASNPEGWPLIDLYHLLTYRKKRRAYWKFGERVTQWLWPEDWSRWEAELVDHYCAELDLSARQRETLKVVYWLERIYQWWLTNSSESWIDHDWIQRNIVETAPLLTSLLHEAD